MPSAYTSNLHDGEQTFEEFILGAARGMGALIMQRDDPLDAPLRLPKTSDWHVNALVQARADLLAAQSLTQRQAERAAEAVYQEKLDRWHESEQQRRDRDARYRDMLAAVHGWMPPTADHVGLKTFMVEQLEESARFDCMAMNPPVRLTGEQHQEAVIAAAQRNVEYHTKALSEEAERAEGRRAWIRALADSIGAEVVDDVVAVPRNEANNG